MARSLDLLRDESKKKAGVLSTVEDQKTALKTTALKSTGFWLLFWYNWFLKKEIADEIDYGPDSLKVMTTSLERHCTWRTELKGFLLYGTENCVSSKEVLK